MLAVLHFNDSGTRAQTVRKEGVERFRAKHPKTSGGEQVAVPEKEGPTYGVYQEPLYLAVCTSRPILFIAAFAGSFCTKATMQCAISQSACVYSRKQRGQQRGSSAVPFPVRAF